MPASRRIHECPHRGRVPLALLAVGLLLLLAACARPPSRAANAVYPPRKGAYPRSVAVLPFSDQSGNADIAAAVRVAFYSHMSTLPFHDVELHEVDSTLRRRRLSNPDVLARVPAGRLGRLLGCDAVIFGNVYEFQRVFAGLYSSMSVGLSIQIWDTRTAEMVWSDRYTARIHEGGLPLSFLDLPMVTLRSGLNLTETVKQHAIDEACRYLVNRIPTPGAVARRAGDAYILQIGAFASEARAIRLQHRFQNDGFPVFIRSGRDDRGVWHRVFMGPYQSLEAAVEVQRRLQKEYQTDSMISRNRT